MEHEKHGSGMAALYLPLAVVISALILSTTMVVVGSQVSTKLGSLADSISGIALPSDGSGSGSGDSGSGSGSGAGTPPSPTVDMANLVKDGPSEGSATAKVTIVEFSDFQCPFCRQFYNNAYADIKKNYIDTGKVKLVFRDFPLSSLHPDAEKAAEAGACADEQGKFWQMHDKMFQEQNKLDGGDALTGPVKSTVRFTTDDLKAWAKAIGVDSTKFASCLDTGKYASAVQKDVAAGSAAGVSGTPTFFVNGTKVVGAQPYAAFQAAIDAALK